MKTIRFQPETASDEKILLKNTISAAPDQGYTIEQVRLGIRILDKIDESTNETVVFEDAEYDFVRDRINSVKWTMASPQIIAFYDAIAGAS